MRKTANQEARNPDRGSILTTTYVIAFTAVGPAPLEAARKATKVIPLVMVASSSDPVAEGRAD